MPLSFFFVQNASVVEKSRVKEIHLRGGRFRPQRAGATLRALLEAVLM